MADPVDPIRGGAGAAGLGTGLRIAIAVTVMVVAAGCAAGPSSSPSAAPNGALSSAGSGGAGGAGGGAGGGGAGAGGGGGGTGAGGGAGGGAGSSDQPGSVGPFVVKQTQTVGGETISGFVCQTSNPFVVNAATSKAAWTFAFVPRDSTAGQVSYAYSIPSAGESHSASGTYTITGPTSDGVLHLSLQVSDHVVFKGFDGNIPLKYTFDLVPGPVVGC